MGKQVIVPKKQLERKGKRQKVVLTDAERKRYEKERNTTKTENVRTDESHSYADLST